MNFNLLQSYGLLAIALATSTSACVRVVEIENEPAQITSVGPLVAEGPHLAVEYTIRDFEGDDQAVDVTVCEAPDDACGPAYAANGGDPLQRVPTVPEGTDVLHEFWWDVACGRIVDGERVATDAATEYVVRVAVRGSDDEVLATEPFTIDQFVLDDRECE